MNRLSCEEMKDVILRARDNVCSLYGEPEIADGIRLMRARLARIKTLCPALEAVYLLPLFIYEDAAKRLEPEDRDVEHDPGADEADEWVSEHGWRRAW